MNFMLSNSLSSFFCALINNCLDFIINFLEKRLIKGFMERGISYFSSVVRVFSKVFVISKTEITDSFAHTKLGDHSMSNIISFSQIIISTSSHTSIEQFFRTSASQNTSNSIQKFFFRFQRTFIW